MKKIFFALVIFVCSVVMCSCRKSNTELENEINKIERQYDSLSIIIDEKMLKMQILSNKIGEIGEEYGDDFLSFCDDTLVIIYEKELHEIGYEVDELLFQKGLLIGDLKVLKSKR